MTIARYLPRLRDWRNELVAWLGISATVAAQVAAALDGIDVDRLEHWLAFIPALVGIVGRNLATGPLTAAALEAERVELLERLIVAEADHAPAEPVTPDDGLTADGYDEALARLLDDEAGQ